MTTGGEPLNAVRVIPYVIHDGSLDQAALTKAAPDQALHVLSWDERMSPPDGARVLLHLSDEHIRELAMTAMDRQWEVGLLPHPEAKEANRALGVRGDIGKVFAAYLDTEAIDADILTCNGQLVFSSVTIGEVLVLKPHDPWHRPPKRRRWLSALRVTRRLRLHSYTLTTAKDQQLKFAALGLVVLEHTQSSLLGRSFEEALSLSDRSLTLLAFAPRSIVAYLGFLLRLLMPGKIHLSRLPPQVGLLRSGRVRVEEHGGLAYVIDGKPARADALDFRILEQTLRLLPGPALQPRQDQGTGKDQVKLKHLPSGDTAQQLAGKPLPLFSHASEEEYRELFVSLRDSAALSSPFLVLMVLSTLLALSGLYANSAPVIIGAMILAPLMAPILSLAMGLARTDVGLMRNALRTLGIGIGAGLACAVAVAWVMPLDNLTNEMAARLSPTLLDLMVAIISGIAGAYAFARKEIASSLAGVAIAVALVPPLRTAGIGLGWGDMAMAKGASLLFVTNLVGIALAASATFLVMGFAPFKLAKKGLAIALAMVLGITAPLTVAFVDLVRQGTIVHLIETGPILLDGDRVNLRLVEARTGSPPLVRVVLSSKKALAKRHVEALKQRLSERIGGEVLIEAELNLRL
jgi:uncharacterized hydrophobic protein (TIGR00271 family)